MIDPIKYELDESEIPRTWLNPVADIAEVAPIIDPVTREPVGFDGLARTMAPPLVEQELSTADEFEIPEAVRRHYAKWRCTPLYSARALEQALGTPARIYYKYEGVAPTGSFKPNTAIPQAYYNKLMGKTGLV